MTDMTAFERQVAGEMLGRAGPVRPVDDLAIYESVAAVSRSQRWGLTMFSALKFVAAAAIVALFGGFLLAGAITTQQDGEVAPAAVTGSPSPMENDTLLPGVQLTVEEVDPGVYRVLGDGVRDLPGRNMIGIAVGQDGGVWVLRSQRFLRLGEGTHSWAVKRPEDVTDFEVALDGTVWAIDRPSEKEQWFIRSYNGATWTTHHATEVFYRDSHLEIGPDDRVWTAWLPKADGPAVVGYFDSTDWQSIGEFDGVAALSVSDTDEAWIGGVLGVTLQRYEDGTWERLLPMSAGMFDAAADGTLWGLVGGGLIRFDGSEWSEWSEEELGFDISTGMGVVWGPLEAASDGTVWIGSPISSSPDATEHRERICDGIRHFDGTSSAHYLSGLCVRELEVADDGSVWVLAGTGRPLIAEPGDLYVITPEALAVIG
jgi:hypothetical protein